MSNKSREVIFGSRIRGAKIRAEGAREEAVRAVRAADRAEAEAWSIRMEGTAGPRSRRHDHAMPQWRLTGLTLNAPVLAQATPC
jgi:hypothetical protein